MLHFGTTTLKTSATSLLLLGGLFAILLAPIAGVQPAAAASAIYTEDFTTTSHLDAANTSAAGWGSGQLQLPQPKLTLDGACETPGYARTVWSAGGYAYVGDFYGLHTFNVTSPAHPTATSFLALMGVSVDLCVAGHYAYVVAQEGILHVINLTGSIPTETNSTSTLGFAYGVSVDGYYAYVAIGLTGLRVVNVRDPRHSDQRGVCNTPGCAYGVWAEKGLAYVADGSSGLQIINVTNPDLPVLLGACDTAGTAIDVCVKGRCAYVADYDYGLRVINITDVAHPTLLGTCNTPGYAISVTVCGDYAYVADDTEGLQVVNVTDVTQPTIIDSYDTTDSAQEVSVDGDHAYIATSDFVDVHGELQVVKIADFTAPSPAGICDTPGYAIGVTVAGDYAYVADGLSGLQVINIADPRHPLRVGFCDTPGYAMKIALMGHYACVADGSSGLQFINVTDPRHPTLVSTCHTPGTAYGVRIVWKMAYVAVGSAGLAQIYYADPRHPFNSTTTDTPGTAYGVFIDDRRLAYVADLDYGLQVINVTWGARVVGSCDTPGSAYDVWVVGNLAYIADGYSGLQVINVTDPRQPTLLGSCDTPGNAAGVCAAGSLAYVADWTAGLQVINITDPRHPTLIATCSLGSYAGGVVVDGDYAYVGDDIQGLRVVEVQRSRCRPGFAPWAMAQSLTVNPAPGAASLVRGTLTCTQSLPSGTSIAYYLSPDAGGHWEGVAPAVEHVFTNAGTQLRWRAVLTTTDVTQTPVLTGLTIAYTTWLDPPSLVAPADDASTNDNTPTFSWTAVTGAVSYLLQLDTVVTFTSGDLRNVTVVAPATSYTPTLALLDGSWFWRVAARDSAGDLGAFAGPRSLSVDATSPSWIQPPTNQMVDFGAKFRYDVNASDGSGIDQYWVNDTSHFAIDNDGVLTNTTALSVGIYRLEVRAYDPYSNYCTATLTVTVRDSIPPVWNQLPTNRIVELGSAFRYGVNASDTYGIDHYSVNDTSHFAIDNNGVLTNSTALTVGVYRLQVRAYDPYSNYCTATFTVTVQDTTPPSWVVVPADQVLAYGQALDYQLGASDLSGLGSWSVNDTAHFAISGAGRLTSITALEAGRYGLAVTVYDVYNNPRSATFTVTVQAETTTTTTTTTQPPPIPGFPAPAVAVGVVAALCSFIAMRRRRRSA